MQECRFQCEGVFHLCIQQIYRGREKLRKTFPQCCRTEISGGRGTGTLIQ